MQVTMLRIIWGRFRRHPGAKVGLAVIAVVAVGTGITGLSPYHPEYSNVPENFQPPSLAHPMGTDALGRDVLTRVLYGGRLSLLIGLGVGLIALAIGTAIGMTAGYYGGWIDGVLMRITDMCLSFPPIFVLILFSAVLREGHVPFLSGGEPIVVILVIGILSWMTIARLVRASFLHLREMDFVTAARSFGAGDFRIITRHILPNAVGTIIVVAILEVAHAILAESALSFIGFGVHPRTPTWGNMLSNAPTHMIKHPWIVAFPGLMIFGTILAINYIGDGLRDALNPRSDMSTTPERISRT